MKIERINLGLAVMIDGVTKMHCDYKMADISYDPATMIYTLVGKTHGHVTLVHSTNVSWSRPLKEDNEQKASDTRSTRTSAKT